jgi:glycyl-tRNA synthetase beta chain
VAKKKPDKAPAAAGLLVELLTEELPPRDLERLGLSFADGIFNGLVRYQLSDHDIRRRRVFATPRRLGVLVPDVLARAQDRQIMDSGPSINAAPAAIAGFARKRGVAVEALEHQETPNGKVVVARIEVRGAVLEIVLAKIGCA